MITRNHKGGSIDIVMIENSDGIGIEYFPITKLAEAEKKAEMMRKYHQQEYTDEKNNGQCRINPPVLHHTSTGAFLIFLSSKDSGWPSTRQNDWCSKYKSGV